MNMTQATISNNRIAVSITAKVDELVAEYNAWLNEPRGDEHVPQ